MNDEPTEITEDGFKIWRNSKGQIHRDNNKPALISPDGRCEWWIDDKYHRDNDLPAIICPNDYCSWWQNGRMIKDKYCTKAEAEEYRKPYYLQKPKKKFIKFDRFEKLIK